RESLPAHGGRSRLAGRGDDHPVPAAPTDLSGAPRRCRSRRHRHRGDRVGWVLLLRRPFRTRDAPARVGRRITCPRRCDGRCEERHPPEWSRLCRWRGLVRAQRGRGDREGERGPRETYGWIESYRRAKRFVTGKGSVLMDVGLAITIFAAVIVILILRTIIHIVPQYQRLVVLALGRYQKMAGPGLVLLLPPPIQVGINVDLREFVVEIPQQTCITKDNAPISIDFLIYQKVMEEQAADSVLKIQNFRTAVTGIATTTLRAVIGDILLDDVLAKREQINEVLRTKLDEVTQRWGVKVTTVEIRELTPPRDVQEAMNRQLTAERTRRASVTEAEGKRASAILVAEGDKQSNILQAEGQRQSQILRAEGFALALDKINEMANHADSRTITLQYLEALKALGASPSTKWIIPTE